MFTSFDFNSAGRRPIRLTAFGLGVNCYPVKIFYDKMNPSVKDCQDYPTDEQEESPFMAYGTPRTLEYILLILLTAGWMLSHPNSSWAVSVVNPTFHQRIDELTSAVRQMRAQTPGDEARYPDDLVRIAWLYVAGDAIPDALVVLKPRKDECAVLASSRIPCRGLLMLGQADGSYRLFAEFPMKMHPVVFRASGQGFGELYYSRDITSQPKYHGYGLTAERPIPLGEPVDGIKLRGWEAIEVDDRNLPLLADQIYAARQFDNASARLAPFRLHFDGINTSLKRKAGGIGPLFYDGAFEQRVGVLVEGLSKDLARVVAAVGWPQTLETRVWSCIDWMVPRRFWEVESRRLGKIGLCVEPLVLGLRKGQLKTTTEYLDTARFSMLQQVGIAYVLRVAPLSIQERERLKSAEQSPHLYRLGTAIGLLLGQKLGIQTLSQADQSLGRWDRLSDTWFEDIENEKLGYYIPSPELSAYSHELSRAREVLDCLQPGKPDRCSGQTGTLVELARNWTRNISLP